MTIYRWLHDPVFMREYDRQFERQRDIAQGLAFRRIQKVGEALDLGLAATDATGQPAVGLRLRTAELVLTNLERLSKRGVDGQAPAAGPLIILPGGARPMALLIGGELPAGAGLGTAEALGQVLDVEPVHPPVHPLPCLPAGAVALETGNVAQAPPVAPVASGLPQWWDARTAKSK